ncbi:MAG: hypothetical protein ACKPKO_33915, partial [Candidatus Fonsibacter sp.]
FALHVVGMIDLCAGEGACAMACYTDMIPYVGITPNEQHSARLMAHFENVILGSMTQEVDPRMTSSFVTPCGPDGNTGGGCSERRKRSAPEEGRCEAQGEAKVQAGTT